MSNTNSTAANAGTVESIEKTKNKAGKALPGTITLPASQVAPEIKNAGQNTGENGNPDILPDRMAVARAKRAEFRAGPAQRANFKGESPDGYNHPTGTLSQANQRPALRENALKSIVAERLKAGRAKQAALRAAGLDHPDTVEIAGKVYDLRKMPSGRRVYFERLARIMTAPMAAVRLKCFECSGFSAIEAGVCNCRDCALWVLRHNRDARKQKTAGELGRVSDDVETGADEAENNAAEEE